MLELQQEQKNDLIIEHSKLIKYVAHRIAARLPSHIEVDDLISAGAIGLIDAAKKFDASRNIKFKTYAEFRIRGAILDELRAQDWIPRSIRQKANHLESVYQELEQKLGRAASDDEVAIAMGVSINEFHSILESSRSVNLLSLDGFKDSSGTEKKSILDCISGSPDDNPHDSARYSEVKKIVAGSIDSLPRNEQLMISLYYYDELTMKEIGEVLNVTESRVSQIHTKAIIRLKARLKKFIEE